VRDEGKVAAGVHPEGAAVLPKHGGSAASAHALAAPNYMPRHLTAAPLAYARSGQQPLGNSSDLMVGNGRHG